MAIVDVKKLIDETSYIVNRFSNYKLEDCESLNLIVKDYFGEKTELPGDINILSVALSYLIMFEHLNIRLVEICKFRQVNPVSVSKRLSSIRAMLSFSENRGKYKVITLNEDNAKTSPDTVKDSEDAGIFSDKEYMSYIFKKMFSLSKILYYKEDRILIKEYLRQVHTLVNMKRRNSVSYTDVEKMFTELFVSLKLDALPEKGRDFNKFVRIRDKFGNFDNYESLVFREPISGE